MKAISATIFFLLLMPTVNAAVVEESVLQELFQGREGFVLCVDELANADGLLTSNCRFTNQPQVQNNVGEYSIVAFNVPIIVNLYENDKLRGAQIEINYPGTRDPQCTYQVYGDTTGVPWVGRNGSEFQLLCAQGRDGEPESFKSYIVDGKNVWVLNLSSMCLIDDARNGRTCKYTWNDAISSYEIISIAGITAEPAATSTPPGTVSPGGAERPLGLARRVATLYNWALGLGGLVGFAVMVYGGFLYTASAGSAERIKEAKLWIQHGLVGLVLLFSSYLILRFINPDLTSLKDLTVRSNPEMGAPEVALDNNIPHYDGASCGGFYNAVTAPVGNFGDPACQRPKVTLTDWIEMIKAEVESNLEGKGYCETNVDRLTRIMTTIVAKKESNYNPNAYLRRSTSGLGAFGLFQMNPSSSNQPDSDVGDVPWRDQIRYAIGKLAEENGEGYWDTWPPGEPKLVDCESGDIPQ